jgi:hypothetical protein
LLGGGRQVEIAVVLDHDHRGYIKYARTMYLMDVDSDQAILHWMCPELVDHTKALTSDVVECCVY